LKYHQKSYFIYYFEKKKIAHEWDGASINNDIFYRFIPLISSTAIVRRDKVTYYYHLFLREDYTDHIIYITYYGLPNIV